MKHRIVFVGVWIAFALALVIFPGFEVRGLAFGMIVGIWLDLLCGGIYASQYYYPIIILGMMTLFSGATVVLLAWILDKAQMPKKIWILLVFSIVLGAAVLNFRGLNYEQWQATPAVAQAMESPEVNYKPTRWDFRKEIVIPRTLAGGLWGLYGIVGACSLCSVAILLKRRIRENGKCTIRP